MVSEVNETFGEEAATKLQSYKLLRRMSQGFITGHAAAATRSALASMPENQVPLPVTEVDIGLEQPFPCILFSDYLRTLAEHKKLDVLTRGVNLESLWDKLQPLYPGHPVFGLPAEARARTIPLYLIGDEGRGWKKSAVFVLGSESLLGTGCDAEDEQTSSEAMKMNFKGNTMLTRQLFACMPKNLYIKDDQPLHKLVNIWAEDFAKLFYDGLQIRPGDGGSMETWRVSVLGLKGDWPALDKLGRLIRHFRREAFPYKAGICHLCMANTRQCPTWHEADFSTAPWIQSMATSTIPWDLRKESGLTAKIPMAAKAKASFFLVDLFHTCHKGVHAELCGSGLELLSHSMGFVIVPEPYK